MCIQSHWLSENKKSYFYKSKYKNKDVLVLKEVEQVYIIIT